MPVDFSLALGRIADKNPALLGVSLIGRDGLAIESADRLGDGTLEAVAAEMTGFLQTMAATESGMASGSSALEGILVEAGTVTAVLTAVTSEYYLLTLMPAGAGSGRVRYEAWKAARSLEGELL
jgi:predicted regulator of Ras-like GTPase activity (Roadblock/LC7/MglB family)